jgi:hypothetical protein
MRKWWKMPKINNRVPYCVEKKLLYDEAVFFWI